MYLQNGIIEYARIPNSYILADNGKASPRAATTAERPERHSQAEAQQIHNSRGEAKNQAKERPQNGKYHDPTPQGMGEYGKYRLLL